MVVNLRIHKLICNYLGTLHLSVHKMAATCLQVFGVIAPTFNFNQHSIPSGLNQGFVTTISAKFLYQEISN